MKKIIIGIIIGCGISMVSSVFAADVKQFVLTKIGYPIIVNGTVYSNEVLPALNYEGNTYLPLKGIGDALGTKVAWNDQLKRVEIGEPVATPSPEGKEYKKDGFNLIKLDGIEYIGLREIITGDSSYGFSYNKDNKTISLTYNNTIGNDYTKSINLISNIPTIVHKGNSYLEYNFYLDKISPLYKSKKSRPSLMGSGSVRAVVKINNEIYSGVSISVYVDDQNNYYLDDGAVTRLIGIKSGDYKLIPTSDNPFIKGIINIENSNNFIIKNKNFLNASDIYVEGSFNNIDGSKSYSFNTNPKNEVGNIWAQDETVITSVSDVLNALDIKFDATFDKDNKLLVFTIL